MSAFLYLSPINGHATSRVDFTNIGKLFAEPDEPEEIAPPSATPRWKLAVFLIVALVASDTILMVRPQLLANPVSVTTAVRTL